jgi:type IV pilus assembly protein PilE
MMTLTMRSGIVRGSKQRGFTLIELMIVVVVAAILAALAFPQYRDYVIRSNRAVAKSLLTQIADRQEQFYVSNKRYANTLVELGYEGLIVYVDRGGTRSDAESGDTIYRVTLPLFTASTYRVAADPRNTQAQDTKCTLFTLNQAGQRTATGSGTDCW